VILWNVSLKSQTAVMRMIELKAAAPAATVLEKDVILGHGGTFSLNLPPERATSNVFLVVDIYELGNPVHPDGHVGWWRYDINHLVQHPTGKLTCDESGTVQLTIEGATPLDEWRNPSHIDASRMELLLVLRSAITNAILSIDRIPVMQSAQDLETFRSSFDRNYLSPRFAPPHYVLPSKRSIHIVSKNVFQRDAVGNLCLGLYRMLRQHQVDVHIFGDHFDLAMNDVVNRRETLASRIGPDDILMYFFSTYDSDLDQLVDMNCACKIAYFHGVTPPKLLQVFDPELSSQCAKAIRQIPLLAKFDRLATNSHASAEVLREIFAKDNCGGSEPIGVIPPKLVGADGSPAASRAKMKAKPLSPGFLYVGRIKSHKRIEDLLYLLSAYRKLDPSARCTIVGLSDNPAYRDYLRWVQVEQLNLPEDAVIWRGSISESELAGVYDEATAYVSMSEHEGFCLPLIEAMTQNVLVFAYDLPAVRETVGMAGVIFSDKSFENLARQLHFLLASPETYEAIIEAQRERAREFAKEMDGRDFLNLLVLSQEP
jgi:glycosyltransferase involved in cell wall biosynthesis